MQLRDYQARARNSVISTTIGQVISPTGTGKSVIQGAVFESAIKMADGFGIYVILTPRIMLTNQLMKDVANQLMSSGISIRTLTIHSGKAANFVDASEEDYSQYLQSLSRASAMGMVRTTNGDDAATAIREAQARDCPILVCCTYHSTPALCRAIRLLQEDDADLKIDNVLCDEAHYIVEEQFFENITEVKHYTHCIHFFTATQKVTKGDQATGMNNTDFYGPVVFRATPREMIDSGWMVRPRLHYERAKSDAPWTTMIADAFTEHQKQVNYDAKMMICCDGTKTILEVVSSSAFNKWADDNQVTVFSITSSTGAYINGEEVDRNEFLSALRSHRGRAVILHIQILTEGIDVPDITGVMFIRNMGTTRFLQSLGRATRVHPTDYGRPTAAFGVNALQWTKPYAWAIVCERDGDIAGSTSNLSTIVEQMRLAGFEPTEEVVIAHDRGTGTRRELDLMNESDPRLRTTFADLFDIQHSFECQRLAALSDEEFFAACPI